MGERDGSVLVLDPLDFHDIIYPTDCLLTV